jgi:hypothetical protein
MRKRKDFFFEKRLAAREAKAALNLGHGWWWRQRLSVR